MKKLLLLLTVCCVFAQGAFAGDCSNMKKKKDPFTNKTERKARVAVGNLSIKWLVEIIESDGAVSMKWDIAMQGEFNSRIDEGTPLLLKLEDGTVITLNTSESSAPVTKAVTGGGTVNIYSTYKLNFKVSQEDVKKLGKSPITAFKIDTPSQDIKNPKIKDNQMGDIMDIFHCLSEG